MPVPTNGSRSDEDTGWYRWYQSLEYLKTCGPDLSQTAVPSVQEVFADEVANEEGSTGRKFNRRANEMSGILTQQRSRHLYRRLGLTEVASHGERGTKVAMRAARHRR